MTPRAAIIGLSGPRLTTAEAALLRARRPIGAILFAIGLVGVLARRNMIVMFLAAEMMLQGVSLSLVAWSRFHGNWGGQMFTLFIITVAACEAALALALVLMLYQRSGRLDMAFWHDLREEGQPAYIDSEVPEERAEDQVWPTLTPAGREPKIDREAEQHRSHI